MFGRLLRKMGVVKDAPEWADILDRKLRGHPVTDNELEQIKLPQAKEREEKLDDIRLPKDR